MQILIKLQKMEQKKVLVGFSEGVNSPLNAYVIDTGFKILVKY